MSVHQVKVMYGKLEGTEGKFARDPSGYLSIEAGIFSQHGLAVSWEHVQGTEERYRRLGIGEAHISMVVGRAALAHYLDSGRTRILGCAMNSCPYCLVVGTSIHELRDLKGKSVACREAPARNAPLTETFQAMAEVQLGEDLALELPESDRRAFELLVSHQVEVALLPRPYALLAEEGGLRRVEGWPEIVDDPLPITIETSKVLAQEMNDEFATFLNAHREGIRYLKTHRNEAVGLLTGRFGHSSVLATKTFDDYLIWMDDRLTVDAAQVNKLIAQVAPHARGRVDEVASDWVLPGALRKSE
jgi:ABC-type nitrate/sulfonate/bicarbonate transport system substrate-binding protein